MAFLGTSLLSTQAIATALNGDAEIVVPWTKAEMDHNNFSVNEFDPLQEK